MSRETLIRKAEQRRREFTDHDSCRDYGEPHPVGKKAMSMWQSLFLVAVIVVALIIFVVSVFKGA